VVGIGALVATSPLAFTALKAAGGAYLLWMGVQAWRHAGAVRVGDAAASAAPMRQLFVKGLIANAINPKVVLFFLSFLPQFVVASQGQVEWQLGLLGVLFTAQAALLFGLLGYFSGSIGVWLNRRPSASQWLDRLAGTVFIGLGVRMIAAR
jgi:threonine/homoserine/homoserine lactone efflux protein